MKPSDAMKQASMTASEYARDSLEHLCQMLGIDRRGREWQAMLAPFAGVWGDAESGIFGLPHRSFERSR